MCFKAEWKSHRFGTTWGWLNNDNFHFCLNYPVKLSFSTSCSVIIRDLQGAIWWYWFVWPDLRSHTNTYIHIRFAPVLWECLGPSSHYLLESSFPFPLSINRKVWEEENKCKQTTKTLMYEAAYAYSRVCRWMFWQCMSIKCTITTTSSISY